MSREKCAMLGKTRAIIRGEKSTGRQKISLSLSLFFSVCLSAMDEDPTKNYVCDISLGALFIIEY